MFHRQIKKYLLRDRLTNRINIQLKKNGYRCRKNKRKGEYTIGSAEKRALCADETCRCETIATGGLIGIRTPDFRICPCGSGRNFEDCCAGKVVSIEQLRWRTTARELKRKLGSFAQQPLFTEVAIWAQHLYLSAIAGNLLYLDDDFVSERCFEWFLFDFPVSGKETVIDIFRQVAANELSEQELALLQWWSKAPSAFYEVKATGGQVILLEDVFTGNSYCVRGFENPEDVGPGSILYLRLLRVGNEFEFSTTG
ncbi:MAG TPA: SEC-C domain-containing protein, partial [Desulfotomaculum sp.]|nr:SEC-C domain-containing protein [Desulfotomaculum sp.]